MEDTATRLIQWAIELVGKLVPVLVPGEPKGVRQRVGVGLIVFVASLGPFVTEIDFGALAHRGSASQVTAAEHYLQWAHRHNVQATIGFGEHIASQMK